MQYALGAAEGFVVVTGAPGMGKTTLIEDLMSEFSPSDYLLATLTHSVLVADDLLRSVAYEFGLDAEGLDKATVIQRLKQHFIRGIKSDCPPLLIVDEAQNLTIESLEELRLLTNFHLGGRPLLQIFLVGQDELLEKLQDSRLEQLRQRVTAATHLEPLMEKQTAAYILHRLRVVGWTNNPTIKASVLPVVHDYCQGVPRRINQFCSRLLLYGSVTECEEIGAAAAKVVAAELAEERLGPNVKTNIEPEDGIPTLVSGVVGD